MFRYFVLIGVFTAAGSLLFAFDVSSRPLSFDEAAQLAVMNSDELRHEYAQRGISEGAWIAGIRAYFPKLSISAAEDDRLSILGTDSFQKNYSLNVDQLLWDGGRTSLSRKLEKAELFLLDSRLARMAQEIADSAISAYRKVLSVRAVLDIRKDSLESLSEQRRILNEEVKLGLSLALDLVDADISIAQARIELISMELELEEAEKQLAEFIGLEQLPPLGEKIDIFRKTVLPPAKTAGALAQDRSPELVEARYSISRKEVELKAASRSWIPAVHLVGSFGLTGQRYPLSRYTWSAGLTIDFSSPYLSGSLNASAGWEPPYDRTARLQNTLSPLPEPAQALTVRSARAALILEKSKYETAFNTAGRQAETAVEKCRLLDSKRGLAVQSMELGAERLRLSELRLKLGQLTRIELMEARIDYTKSGIAAVEAASALLEAERELEKFLDLRPGELNSFTVNRR